MLETRDEVAIKLSALVTSIVPNNFRQAFLCYLETCHSLKWIQKPALHFKKCCEYMSQKWIYLVYISNAFCCDISRNSIHLICSGSVCLIFHCKSSLVIQWKSTRQRCSALRYLIMWGNLIFHSQVGRELNLARIAQIL